MSFDANWDIDKYKEEHECEEHWLLRKAFMERWKDDYSEERLVCLARVFTNIEFMGCRYPTQIMQEVGRLSHEVAQHYRKLKKTKLQRTFVSASDAAEDRARGVKREGGIIINDPPNKSTKINFVPQGDSKDSFEIIKNETNVQTDICSVRKDEKLCSEVEFRNDYLSDMLTIKCLDPRCFREEMFNTEFGRLVLLMRPWSAKLSNIQSSCLVCRVPLTSRYEDYTFSIYLNNILLAESKDIPKAAARCAVEKMAWDTLREKVVCVLIKEQWIAQGDRISMSDVSSKKEEFGMPVENNVAVKMMKMMGWKGGGLGADAQGIAEPIKPHMQMVNRAGLGSNSDINQLRKDGQDLMKRYIASDTFELDLVFSGEFSKEERAVLHQCAQKAGLASKSYGNVDRFLVVKKKLDPFSLVRAVIQKGGETPKYKVFLPEVLKKYR